MAEILLSLTIIGVVAAITLPSLTGNINERTWNTQRKALYARFSQALALMPNLNGYGALNAEQTDSDGNITKSAQDTAAETFVTEGLSKVLKINNICDSEHLADCGIPANITTLDGRTLRSFTDSYNTLTKLNEAFSSNPGGWGKIYSQLDTKAAAFETQNGESILVYYYPYCVTSSIGENLVQYNYVQGNMCANFVYDLNGSKGPNTVGKDIGFMTAIYSSDPIVVAPVPLGNIVNKKGNEASSVCKSKDGRLPNRYELMSLFYNRTFWANNVTGGLYWSGTKYNTNNLWALLIGIGGISPSPDSGGGQVQCVKN